MPSNARALTRPPIILSETEADRLSALALQAETTAPQVAGLLLEEIERAEIRPDTAMPSHVARMHSVVRFAGEDGRPRSVLLVYPAEADIAAGKVSILTHVGAGLIGLSPDQAIPWPDRDGRERTLKVLDVTAPERLEL